MEPVQDYRLYFVRPKDSCFAVPYFFEDDPTASEALAQRYSDTPFLLYRAGVFDSSLARFHMLANPILIYWT